jgi:hypothetical protein
MTLRPVLRRKPHRGDMRSVALEFGLQLSRRGDPDAHRSVSAMPYYSQTTFKIRELLLLS